MDRPNANALIAGTEAAGFCFRECYASDMAARLGIDNAPPDDLIPTIIATADLVLMPIRVHYGRPWSPLSLYRSIDLERAICARAITAARTRAAAAGESGEAAETAYLMRKQHPKGRAADIRVPGVDPLTLGRWIAFDSGIDFDQLIFEFYDPADPARGWVHCSQAAGSGVAPRRQILWTADGATYHPGFPPASAPA